MRHQSAPAPAGSATRWTLPALAVALAALAATMLSPSTPGVLTWFLPVTHSVAVLGLIVVAALGALDSAVRGDSRALGVAGAAAALASVLAPEILTFPGVVPGGLRGTGEETTSLLSSVATVAAPALVGWALVRRAGPLASPRSSIAKVLVLGVLAGLSVTVLAVALAPFVPATVQGRHSTAAATVLDAVALAATLTAAGLFLRGRRGDARVTPAVLASLALLGAQEVSELFVRDQYVPMWYVQHLLFCAPAAVLLAGQLALFRHAATGEIAALAEREERVRELAYLTEAATELAGLSSAADIVGCVVRLAGAVRGRDDRGMLLGVEGENLRVVEDQHSLLMAGFVHPLAENSMAERAILERRALGGPIAEALHGRTAALMEAAGLQHGAWAPVLRGDRAVAVLAAKTREGLPFSATELRMLGGLARLCGLALAAAESLAEREQGVQRLRRILDYAPNAIVTADLEGRITGWNDQAERVLGWSRDEALGRLLTETIVPERFRAGHEAGLRRYRETGWAGSLGATMQVQALRRDGSEVPVELAVSAGGVEGEVVGFIRDISERVRAEALASMQFAVTRALADSASLEDAVPRILTATAQLVGADAGQLWTPAPEGRTLVLRDRWRSEETRGEPGVQAVAARGAGVVGRAWTTRRPQMGLPSNRRDGGAAIAFPVVHQDQVLGVLEVSGTGPLDAGAQVLAALGDVGEQLGQFMERKRVEAALAQSLDRLASMAATDTLTGLANRREFERVLELPRRHGYAVLAIDVDNLKTVNDSFGHEAGDALLRGVGTVLRDCVRSDDLVARTGGDEFAAILPGAGPDEAATVADRLRRAMHGLSLPHGQARVSVGCAVGDAGSDGLALWAQADEALFTAKRAGRDRFEMASADSRGKASMLARWEALLPALIEENGLRAVFQPIVDLGTGDIFGYEALARPVDCSDEISVESLFAAAQRTGRARDLDWVCRRAAVRDASPIPAGVPIFINVGAAFLLDPLHDVEQMLLLMAWARRSPSDVVLEITEREAVRDLFHLRQVVAAHREHGFRFALDDVGEGHSTFEVLAAATPEFVKVAMSLTSRADEVGSRAAICAVVAFAETSGARVVGEGLATPQSVDAMRALGVHLGQGFALGRPAAAEDGSAALALRPGPAARAS